MKIVKILGGLGNQMFQYAFYLALKEKYPNEEVKIDTSCFRGYHLHNGYELEKIFGLKAKEATFWDKLSIAYPYNHYRVWQIGKILLPKRRSMFVEKFEGGYDSSVFDKKGSCYYDGYWQDERYFKHEQEIIRDAFVPKSISKKNIEFEQKLHGKKSLSIHVRRGDYISNPYFSNICDLAYYQKALHLILNLEKIDIVCIFSNDIEWCRIHISPLLNNQEVVYVDWNKRTNSYQDIYLMSLCNHNIIANSSFSWWGGWLNKNKNKKVICPSKWNKIKGSLFKIPDKWIKI